MSWFSNIRTSVESALTPQDESILTKLTLQTTELTAYRNRLEMEERRKEIVRDALAELLPWETRDEEREILVEECRESIMALSTKEETFLEEEVEGSEGFPLLLKEFDLDAHVGLIQRLLSLDANLVEMHAQFSGAGPKEVKFWKNYFQNCALVREKSGLSVDEIWNRSIPSFQENLPIPSNSDHATETTEEITFEAAGGSSHASVASTASDHHSAHHQDVDIVPSVVKTAVASSLEFASAVIHPTPPPLEGEDEDEFHQVNQDQYSPSKEYEIISGNEMNSGKQGGDDLDDLAAEIARELET